MQEAAKWLLDIATNPDDVETYLVYADWLIARGDPRGELISVQHERMRLAKCQDHEADLLAAHDFLGTFAIKNVNVVWHLGFVREIEFQVPHESAQSTAELYAQLADHPSMQFLHKLAFRAPAGLSFQALDFEPITEAMTRWFPETVTDLFIGEARYTGTGPAGVLIGDLEPVLHANPNLVQLSVCGRAHLGTLVLPRLRSLDVMCSTMEPEMLRAVAAADWPTLARLRLAFGTAEFDAEGDFSDYSALLAARRTPLLRHVEFIRCPHPELLSELVGAPLLQQLETLSLTWGSVTEETAAALLGAPEAFRHLEDLDLRHNEFGAELAQRLSDLGAQAPSTSPGSLSLTCSFCGKNQREVTNLIAGPSVFICNECIALCSDIIVEEGFAPA